MKVLLVSLTLLLGTVVANAQFSDKGYKNLKLGMSEQEVKSIFNIEISRSEETNVTIDGIELSLGFEEGLLYSITSTSPNSKVLGNDAKLIGKSKSEVKRILGSKLVHFSLGEDDDAHYVYYVDAAAKANEITSCLLFFGEDDTLEYIAAVHNP